MAELLPGEVAVSKTEYDSLLKDSANLWGLQEKLSKIEEAKENQRIAMEKAKDELSESKRQAKIDLSKKEEEIKTIRDKLWLEENDELLPKLETLIQSDSKYSEILQKESEKRAETITSYEKVLWEEFIESKKELFENLSDEAKENLLKEFIDLKGLSDKTEPKVDITDDNKTDPNKNPLGEFDETLQNGWTSADLISSIANSI